MSLTSTDLFFADNYPLCKYENELNLSDTIVDDDKFDVTGLDYQHPAVMNVRKTRRGMPKTYCENSTDSESTPKEKTVKLHKNQTNVINRKIIKKEHLCPQCPKAYSYERSLKRHLKYECGKECKFGCPYCNQKSHLLEHIHRHVRRRHKGHSVYAVELY